MAKTTVRGEVTRINEHGPGLTLRESWTNRQGIAQFRYWSCWMPTGQTPNALVGDVVKVTGRLDVKVSPKHPEHVDVALQNSIIAHIGMEIPR